jgi:hypothetical protein
VRRRYGEPSYDRWLERERVGEQGAEHGERSEH